MVAPAQDASTGKTTADHPRAELAAVILFDGECGACNRLVQWIVARDEQQRFMFAPLGGKTAAEAGGTQMDRIFVLDASLPGPLGGAQAVGWIASRLPGRCPAAVALTQRLLPRFVADLGYALFARIRRWVPMPRKGSRGEHCSLEASRRILP